MYGFDRRCWAAVSGSFLGIPVTCVLGILFTDLFQIHGAVMSYSESLLYSGYAHLSLTQIFMASIFIGASGAVMDLSVDITSAVHEVVKKRPDLSWQEAARSGLNVGRAAMGTMTTTLLFAYSGGYIALLMVFMAQGTPVDHILNYKYVAAEIIHTVIGSFGLVTVAPSPPCAPDFSWPGAAAILSPRRSQMDDLPEPPALHGSALLNACRCCRASESLPLRPEDAGFCGTCTGASCGPLCCEVVTQPLRASPALITFVTFRT